MPIQAPQWTEFLTCPICYNEFEERIRQPVSLGCGHTLCKSCLAQLHRTQCPFDQATVNTDTSELPVNTALLQLVGADISNSTLPNIQCVKDNATEYCNAIRFIEELALFMKPLTSSGSNENLKLNSGGSVSNGNGNVLTRPMQRKLVTLVNCQLAEEEGRIKAMRAARSLGERTVTELILLHQNQQQLSANLWAAVRARGCQFLGPAMQEDALQYILLALEGGEALSRKVLVLFVVQRLEPNFPQASKTSIGHVVQLLYRASCFKVTKRDDDSSLMQLKENFRTYDALRKEHDAQIVQIATEAGLRISPDQWSSLLYGDLEHKSHMQSIIDKLQSPASFATSIQELIIALQRSGDPGQLTQLRTEFELLSKIDASPEAVNPEWQELEQGMRAVHAVVHGLVEFQKTYGNRMKGPSEPQQSHNTKFKTSLCRDFQRGNCPRGNTCTFAHSDDEMQRFGRKPKRDAMVKPVVPRGPSGGPDQYSPVAQNGTGDVTSLSEGGGSSIGGQNANISGTSRASPLCVPTQGVEMSNGTYRTHGQHPAQFRQPADLVPRMKHLAIHSPQPVYADPPPPGFVAPQSHVPYDRPSYSRSGPQNDAGYYYYGHSPPVTIGSGSYSNVSARGDVKSGVMTPPRNSPQTVQDENLTGSRESPVTNGHVDQGISRQRYQEIPRRRRDLGPAMQQSQQPPAGYPYDPPYTTTYPSPDIYNNCRNSEVYLSPHYGRYDNVVGPQGAVVAGYPVRPDMGTHYDCYTQPHYYSTYGGRRDYQMYSEMVMHSRKPYIPDEDKEATDGLASDHGSLNLVNILGEYKMSCKDTGLSSASSGVSSGSPLSHSPAASHCSSSSLSPRGSPITWQTGSDGDLILSRMYSTSRDSNNLPPPPVIWSSPQSSGKQGWSSDNFGLLIQAYHNDREKSSETEVRDPSESVKTCAEPSDENDNAIARELQTFYDEEMAGHVKIGDNNVLERRHAQDRAKKEQEKTDLQVARNLQLLEEEADMERQKKQEYDRLLKDRKMLLEKQRRENQEMLDRKLAERIAFEDAQQAGLVRPEPVRRPMPIGYNPDVISRGLPATSYCHHGNSDDFRANSAPKINGFGSFNGFHNGCGTSLANDDDLIDGSKLAPGSSGDIRVQE